MLKKLIKYDFKAIFKYWWFAALASVIMSVIGGFCLLVMSIEKELPDMIETISNIGFILVCFSFLAFVLASVILIIRRYYTNFFTDEGYLTFTLPVKKHQLLSSKLITAVSIQVITVIVCIIDLVIILCIGKSSYFFSDAFLIELESLFKDIGNMCEELGIYTVIYIVEVLLLILLSMFFTTLFIFCCITFASVISKKARILKAIGIYYLTNSALTFALQIFMLFGINTIGRWYSVIPTDMSKLTVALSLFTAICFIALICSLVYALQYRLLDKKLNLS